MNWVDTVKGVSQKTWNTIRSVGPFLVSQSDRTSEAYQRHLLRLGEAEAAKQLLLDVVSERKEVRKLLMDKWALATAEEKVRIEADLRFIEQGVRQLKVAAKSLDYEKPGPSTDPQMSAATQEIGDHWLDSFNELAKIRNEEWREDLLARALAKETAAPGSVGLRIIWLIGNMETRDFQCLAVLLEHCVWPTDNTAPFLPDVPGRPAAERRIYNSKDHVVGQYLYALDSLGVLAPTFGAAFRLTSDMFIRHQGKIWRIEPLKPLEITGALFTPIGAVLARFCDVKPNPNTVELTAEWLDAISQGSAKVTCLG